MSDDILALLLQWTCGAGSILAGALIFHPDEVKSIIRYWRKRRAFNRMRRDVCKSGHACRFRFRYFTADENKMRLYSVYRCIACTKAVRAKPHRLIAQARK